MSDIEIYSRSDFDRSMDGPDRGGADLHFIGGRSVAKVERLGFLPEPERNRV